MPGPIRGDFFNSHCI